MSRHGTHLTHGVLVPDVFPHNLHHYRCRLVESRVNGAAAAVHHELHVLELVPSHLTGRLIDFWAYGGSTGLVWLLKKTTFFRWPSYGTEIIAFGDRCRVVRKLLRCWLSSNGFVGLLSTLDFTLCGDSISCGRTTKRDKTKNKEDGSRKIKNEGKRHLDGQRINLRQSVDTLRLCNIPQ